MASVSNNMVIKISLESSKSEWQHAVDMMGSTSRLSPRWLNILNLRGSQLMDGRRAESNSQSDSARYSSYSSVSAVAGSTVPMAVLKLRPHWMTVIWNEERIVLRIVFVNELHCGVYCGFNSRVQHCPIRFLCDLWTRIVSIMGDHSQQLNSRWLKYIDIIYT
ncbi:unnamed protein product [Nesidiocoris tenuis]|uniref:Uncharacterized protein n=1 Tax=Nesidiocoris tenuis TaxID=355587 RepID=A0A6H5GSQ5_9HEMI|nr:unnamed protein product [Nesidiocoris tenuis]